MNTIDTFKTTLDQFFTKAHCNNRLHEEKDFQKKVAQYLIEHGYQVLREVEVKKEEVSAIAEELGQDYILVDVVAYADGCFFPIELKFENVNYQSEHLTPDAYETDGKKIRILFDVYQDIFVARKRVLTNNNDVRKDFSGEWHPLLDGESGEKEFMWQWHWFHDGIRKRDAKHYFTGIWNATIVKRQESGFKEGESAGFVGL